MNDLSRFTALLVEDNPDDQWFARRAFKKHSPGTNLLLAADGVEALALIGTGPRPDFVLLDMNLPKMGGREVLGALRADVATKSLPVIAFTTPDDDPEEFAGDPNTVCLSKPLDFPRMLEALDRLGLRGTAG